MKCPNCGNELKQAAPFCGYCGKPLAPAPQPRAPYPPQPPRYPQPPVQPQRPPMPQQPVPHQGYRPAPQTVQQPMQQRVPQPYPPYPNPYGMPPQPPKKKKKGGIIALVVVLGVLLLAAIVILLVSLLGGKDDGMQSQDDSYAESGMAAAEQPAVAIEPDAPMPEEGVPYEIQTTDPVICDDTENPHFSMYNSGTFFQSVEDKTGYLDSDEIEIIAEIAAGYGEEFGCSVMVVATASPEWDLHDFAASYHETAVKYYGLPDSAGRGLVVVIDMDSGEAAWLVTTDLYSATALEVDPSMQEEIAMLLATGDFVSPFELAVAVGLETMLAFGY